MWIRSKALYKTQININKKGFQSTLWITFIINGKTCWKTKYICVKFHRNIKEKLLRIKISCWIRMGIITFLKIKSYNKCFTHVWWSSWKNYRIYQRLP